MHPYVAVDCCLLLWDRVGQTLGEIAVEVLRGSELGRDGGIVDLVELELRGAWDGRNETTAYKAQRRCPA